MEKLDRLEHNVIIINSISCYKKALATIYLLKKHNEVHLYLDNYEEDKNTFIKFKK